MSTDVVATVDSAAAGLLDTMLAAGGAVADPLAREWQLNQTADTLAAALALLTDRAAVDGVALALHHDEVSDEAGNNEVIVTVNGQRVYTVSQIAARRGVLRSSLSAVLTRAGDRIKPLGLLDKRTPLYTLEQIDQLYAERPGMGAPGQPKPRKAQR